MAKQESSAHSYAQGKATVPEKSSLLFSLKIKQ